MLHIDRRSTPFYKNTADALDEVGITARQLSYWRKEGLFTSELGDNKRYTRDDIAKLKMLKKLIDVKEGLGLPVETVRKLQESVPDSPSSFPAWVYCRYLDLKTEKLINTNAAYREFLNDVLKTPFFDEELERALVTLALAVFKQYRSNSSSPSVFAAKRGELFKLIERMDLAARVERTTRELTERELMGYADMDIEAPTHVEEVSLVLRLPDDPPLSADQLHELADEQDEYLKGA